MPAANQARLLGRSFFPNLISPPFSLGLHGAFYLSAAICVIAALASFLRGKRYIYGQEKSAEAVPVQDVITSQEEASSAR